MKQVTLMGSPLLSKRDQNKSEKNFVDTIMSIFRPQIVMPSYEDMPIPQEIKESIQIERLLLAMKQEKLSSETEALWYISTASFVAPLDREWTDIMMYLCRKWLISKKRELPDFLQEQIILEDMAEIELHRLRSWLYKKGMEAIK